MEGRTVRAPALVLLPRIEHCSDQQTRTKTEKFAIAGNCFTKLGTASANRAPRPINGGQPGIGLEEFESLAALSAEKQFAARANVQECPKCSGFGNPWLQRALGGV